MTRSLFSRFAPVVLSVAALSSAANAHVQAVKFFGNLLVFGSSQVEVVNIRGNSSALLVQCDPGTLVNGQPSVVFTGVYGSVLVDLGGGNDRIGLTDCDIDQHLVLLMGGGNDIGYLSRNAFAGSILVDGGLQSGSSDLVVMDGDVGNGNFVDGDAYVLARNLSLIMRAQETMGRTEVWSGSGNDLVTLAASNFHGNVRVETDGGADHVAIGDEADVVPNLFGARLDVRLGAGNDRLTVRRSTVSGQTRLQGDAGTDVVESAAPAYGNAFQAALQFTGFESTL